MDFEILIRDLAVFEAESPPELGGSSMLPPDVVTRSDSLTSSMSVDSTSDGSPFQLLSSSFAGFDSFFAEDAHGGLHSPPPPLRDETRLSDLQQTNSTHTAKLIIQPTISPESDMLRSTPSEPRPQIAESISDISDLSAIDTPFQSRPHVNYSARLRLSQSPVASPTPSSRPSTSTANATLLKPSVHVEKALHVIEELKTQLSRMIKVVSVQRELLEEKDTTIAKLATQVAEFEQKGCVCCQQREAVRNIDSVFEDEDDLEEEEEEQDSSDPLNITTVRTHGQDGSDADVEEGESEDDEEEDLNFKTMVRVCQNPSNSIQVLLNRFSQRFRAELDQLGYVPGNTFTHPRTNSDCARVRIGKFCLNVVERDSRLVVVMKATSNRPNGSFVPLSELLSFILQRAKKERRRMRE